ncbi:MAG: tRNA (adenosine(37)-N6)-threonylcarbamoyltransferase complex dimerization subunit type 1 TsaB [Chitinispirillales bacterium]|jgi:tRNA threonylcarbamoyladenosine biosynthesis protein TsaB|nr:tRNA (adenosine(37)-N6)-threonylcarbamoyltransferase complex dimerization subunit type 1 TsaB [Chitinispirillales bacterium]
MGIDTSSADLGVSVAAYGSPLSSVCRYVANSHAEHITQAVKTTLDLAGVNISQINRIAVSAGPGSFTGLRIGLSFVKGLSLNSDVKVLPLSSLMVLAHAVNCHTQRRVFTALDARQGRIHWSSFICSKGIISRLTEDRLSAPEELINELKGDDLLVTDTMGYTRSTVFGRFDGKTEIIDVSKNSLQRAVSCAVLGFYRLDEKSLWKRGSEVVPNYLQMSAAQEKLCV